MIYLNHAGTSWPKPPEAAAALSAVFAGSPEHWAADFERGRAASALQGVLRAL